MTLAWLPFSFFTQSILYNVLISLILVTFSFDRLPKKHLATKNLSYLWCDLLHTLSTLSSAKYFAFFCTTYSRMALYNPCSLFNDHDIFKWARNPDHSFGGMLHSQRYHPFSYLFSSWFTSHEFELIASTWLCPTIPRIAIRILSSTSIPVCLLFSAEFYRKYKLRKSAQRAVVWPGMYSVSVTTFQTVCSLEQCAPLWADFVRQDRYSDGTGWLTEVHVSKYILCGLLHTIFIL